MDIWRWVIEAQSELADAGHERLAMLLEEIPEAAVAEEHERLEALIPEALALARSLRQPWLELFVRHWALQSRVLCRREVTENMDEAISLLEFAHRPETRDCPQAICAAQDLAHCFAAADGPGFAAERLAACDEMLARIDARWPCFSCLSGERLTALVDAGRASEAVEFIEAQAAATRIIEDADERKSRAMEVRRGIARAHVALGQFDQALAAAERELRADPNERERRSAQIWRTRALVGLGRASEAMKDFPTAGDVLRAPDDHVDWAIAFEGLVRAGSIPNDLDGDAPLGAFGSRLRQTGARRDAFEMTMLRLRLAIARGALARAEVLLEEADALAAELRSFASAKAALDVARADLAPRLAARVVAPLPADREAFARGETGAGLEEILEGLAAARRDDPSDDELVGLHGRILLSLRHEAAAVRLLRERLAAGSRDPDMLRLLGEALLQGGDHDALAELFEPMTTGGGEEEILARFILGRAALERDDLAAGRAHLERVAALDPEAMNTRRLLAAIAATQERWADSVALWDEVVAAGDDEESASEADHWHRVVAATMAGQWDRVHESSRALGLPVETESGPIDERWELMLIALTETDGRRTTRLAGRTGPVTARILALSRPSFAQHYHDVVVFDPAPLDDEPENDGDEQLRSHALIAVLSEGGFESFELDGVHPGKEQLDLMREALDGAGHALQILSDERYVLANPETGDDLPGVFGLIGAKQGADLSALAALLASHARDFAHPLCWPSLLGRIGRNDEAERQRQTLEDLGA